MIFALRQKAKTVTERHGEVRTSAQLPIPAGSASSVWRPFLYICASPDRGLSISSRVYTKKPFSYKQPELTRTYTHTDTCT